MNGQIAINSLVSVSVYVLAGVSFYIPFLVGRFFHFTHGAVYALAAYIAFALMTHCAVSLVMAIVISVTFACIVGVVLEWGLYGRMRRHGTSTLVLLLASLGAYTLIQNTLSLVFGDSAVAIPHSRDWGVYSVAGGHITKVQSLQVVTALIVSALLWAFLKKTKVGTQMRAVGQDHLLAECLGIRVDNMRVMAFGIGYGLAGLAGIIAACNVDIAPTMGMRPMMMGIVAMIIGRTTLWGVVCGAMMLGIAQHIGVIWLPTQWQDAIALFILLAFLIFKPKGFEGKKVKEATV